MLDRTEIEAILPHRDPFLMIDRVMELEPGEYAVAEKDILATDDVFRGHFPGHPVFPGVLQLEALAQTGAVAVLSRPESKGKPTTCASCARWCPAILCALRCVSPPSGGRWARVKARPSSDRIWYAAAFSPSR
jgi:3-hydroxymyristoyl/3-hydroxydecanoyl-(acyl carrier protein) dehydratase